MIKIILHLIKFTIIGCLIVFGLGFYNKSNPVYLQNIVFWLLVFIPCVGAYESIFSMVVKKVFTKYIEKQNTSEKMEKTFQEKLDEKLNQTKKL
jgi:phosphate/sulfate permease